MHAPRYRQLLAPVFAIIVSNASWCVAATPPTADPQLVQELQALQLAQTTVEVRELPPEQWLRLDQAYRELLVKHPESVVVRNAYADTLWSRGEQDRAERLWQEALQLDPQNSVLHHRLGICALADANPRRAAEHYRKACEIEPGNAVYHFDLANVMHLFRHQLLDQQLRDSEAVLIRSIEHYGKASALQPLDPDYAKAYAEAFYGMAKPDWTAALSAWTHFLEVAPQKDFAWANLARVHLKLGQKDEARKCVAAMQNPEFATLKARLAERISRE